LIWLACTAGPITTLDKLESEVETGSVEIIPGESATEEDPIEALFDPMMIHTLSLEIEEAAWADIQGNPWAKN
jgi:hypothetical protein